MKLQTFDLATAIRDEAQETFSLLNWWDGEPDEIKELISAQIYGLNVYFDIVFTKHSREDYNPSTNKMQDFPYYIITDITLVEAEKDGIAKFVEFSYPEVIKQLKQYEFER